MGKKFLVHRAGRRPVSYTKEMPLTIFGANECVVVDVPRLLLTDGWVVNFGERTYLEGTDLIRTGVGLSSHQCAGQGPTHKQSARRGAQTLQYLTPRYDEISFDLVHANFNLPVAASKFDEALWKQAFLSLLDLARSSKSERKNNSRLRLKISALECSVQY
jgi:hypothetical protein